VTSNHFFIPKARAAASVLVLEGREHRHLGRVLRARPGDVVTLFDEEGAKYTARIEEIAAEATTLVCLERTPGEARRTRIGLAQGLLKAKTMDFVVQKSAELGLSDFFPVTAARSVARFEGEGAGSGKVARKIGRWEQIALEAAKQSRLGRAVRIHAPLSLDEFLADPPPDAALFLSERRGSLLRDVLRDAGDAPPATAAVLVGPEGGWTDAEEEAIAGRGYRAVSLGRSVLRAETAALAAAALLAHFWNG
jgi:16S rRNA (uracil1498-N3)-methyltransferase